MNCYTLFCTGSHSIFLRSCLFGLLGWVLSGCDLASQDATTPTSIRHLEQSDYLSPALRTQAEQLKADAQSTATNENNIVARLAVLAKWIDARALAGMAGPPFATNILVNASLPVEAVSPSKFQEIDSIIEEYTFRDENPEAFGVLSSDNLGPFEANSFATIKQNWQVGSQGMSVGGGLWLARHFSALYGEFQTESPNGEGYITIESSNPSAEFTSVQILARGPHGGFRAPEPALAFRLTSGSLSRGDTVTLTYGSQKQSGAGLRISTIAGPSVPLPIYVSFAKDAAWMMLPILPMEVRGSATQGVKGFSPSIVRAGEIFSVSVRAEDEFFNRASGKIPKFLVYDGKRLIAETQRNGSAIQVLDLSFNELGPKWLTIVSSDGELVGRFNPILVKKDPAQRIFWGDTHGHSGYAEGIGSLDYFMQFARDDARLDYVTISEHDTFLDEAEWRLMQDTVAEFNSPGQFAAILGYEWTTPAIRGGHHNVLYRTAKDRDKVSALEYETLSELYLELRARNAENDVVIIPHAHNPGDARFSDPTLARLIEIMSMHGTHQWFANRFLEKGLQVGFVAASDDHLSHPGYSAPSRNSLAQRGGLSAVLARDKQRDTIFDALRNRETYASSIDRIIVEMQVNGTAMGARGEFSPKREIVGQVIGSHGIDSITLYKNSEPIETRRFDQSKWSTTKVKQKLRIGFYSDSKPYYSFDAPRGWRHWNGKLIASGFRIDSIRGADFVNPNTQHIRSEIDNEVYSFATQSRGNESLIELEVSGLSAAASLRLELEDALETGSAPPFLRKHQVNLGGVLELELADLISGPASKNFPVQGYDDRISISPAAVNLAKIQKFRFLDDENPMYGDQYFVVAKQVNGGIAWSSPIWIGGYSAK